TNVLRRRREVRDEQGEYAGSLKTPPTQDWSVAMRSLQVALQQLPDEHREALILVGAAGLSYEEAAEICGCALGTIKSRVNRPRALYDEDRVAYQRRYQDAGAAGYRGRRDVNRDVERYGDEQAHLSPEAEAAAYHGQEFGVEGHGYGSGEPAPSPGWGFQRGD